MFATVAADASRHIGSRVHCPMRLRAEAHGVGGDCERSAERLRARTCAPREVHEQRLEQVHAVQTSVEVGHTLARLHGEERAHMGQREAVSATPRRRRCADAAHCEPPAVPCPTDLGREILERVERLSIRHVLLHLLDDLRLCTKMTQRRNTAEARQRLARWTHRSPLPRRCGAGAALPQAQHATARCTPNRPLCTRARPPCPRADPWR